MATYQTGVSTSSGHTGRKTYQVNNDAGEASIERKAEASLHTLKSRKSKSVECCLLHTAQGFGRAVANHHVALPLAVVGIGVKERQDRSMEENLSQVEVPVHVSDKV